jgi:hypothetical protein
MGKGREMMGLGVGRYVFAVTVAVAVLAGCGQSQSGPPVPARDGAPSKVVHTGEKPAGIKWNLTVYVLGEYETATIVAYCPAKSVVTGGGWNVDSLNSAHTYVKEDRPGARFDSWSVTISNDSSSKATVQVYAGCLPST